MHFKTSKPLQTDFEEAWRVPGPHQRPASPTPATRNRSRTTAAAFHIWTRVTHRPRPGAARGLRRIPHRAASAILRYRPTEGAQAQPAAGPAVAGCRLAARAHLCLLHGYRRVPPQARATRKGTRKRRPPLVPRRRLGPPPLPKLASESGEHLQ